MIEYTNEDCLVGMKRYPDKYFELAICDPPYGIGENAFRAASRSKACKTKDWGSFNKTWDIKCPDKEYFNELERVSTRHIIWGGNHMMSQIGKSSPCWLVWNKDNSGGFADCELAYTNFTSAVRMFTYRWNGMIQADMKNKENRIHPTQKPVALYKWILSTYAKQGDKILDTHVGSASSLIACYDMGFDAVGFELDPDYYKASKRRLDDFMRQPKLTEFMTEEAEQLEIEVDG